MWASFLSWMEVNRIGDLTGLAGIIISLFGFAVTIVGVVKSKNAAQRAESAARSTRDSIRFLNTVVDFSAAITALEEIKRLHRSGQWALLPDRYAALRKLLVALRATQTRLSANQQATVQNAVANLYAIEAAVERALDNNSGLKSAKFNTVISRDVDDLIAALAELQENYKGD